MTLTGITKISEADLIPFPKTRRPTRPEEADEANDLAAERFASRIRRRLDQLGYDISEIRVSAGIYGRDIEYTIVWLDHEIKVEDILKLSQAGLIRPETEVSLYQNRIHLITMRPFRPGID